MKYPALLSLIALTACVESAPVVSDFNGSSVKVVTMAITSSQPTEASFNEATRICRAGGKRKAE